MTHSRPNTTTTGATEEKIELAAERILYSQEDNDIHEGQISFTHGFVPHQPFEDSLPSHYRAWDEIQKNLSGLLAESHEREAIHALPLLDASDPEALPNRYLSRAASILG